jgi:hypothetical protein
VNAGDLLVDWFGQYNAAGQVQVSDNVNGTCTRAVSEAFSNGTGDIALYYLANSKAAPNGLTVAISASAPAYLQEAIADFSGVATTALLDQAVRKRITARSGSPWARLEGCLLNLGRAATGGLRSRV